jgi:hypothetical protein
MNDWERKHGARRRTIDKKLLAELERQIAKEERAIVLDSVNPAPQVDRDAERRRIALAFGRPLV